MDLLKKILLIAFYVSVIAVGIVGFLALRSMRQIPPPPGEVQQKEVMPTADSTTRLIYTPDDKVLPE